MTETQVGSIAETIVACQLLIASKGRLSPFHPLADDDGIDLIILDKRTRRSVSLQIKCRTKIDAGGTIQFDTRKQTFVASDDAYLLAVFLDIETGAVARAWLVPMNELPGIAQPNSLTIVPSPKETSRDRYTPYRCTDMGEVARRITVKFDEGGGVMVQPTV